MFRGKPAITKFDRLITPSRKSSQSFATPTGAALEREALSACSRLAHPASGLTQPTPLCCLRLPTVRLAGRVNLLAHYAKGTLSPTLQSLRPTPGFAPAARGGWLPRFPRGTLRYRPRRCGALGVAVPPTSAASRPTRHRWCGRLGHGRRLASNPKWNVRRFFQQQVPLPLPCVNFAQIACAAIRAQWRREARCAPPTAHAFRA